ncbi:hypothetical protein BGX27_008435, partial [Mortierella sp. AM989]
MGNTKSRQAGGAQSKSRSKHTKLQSGGSSNSNGQDRRRSNKNKNKNQAPLPNDSGHYSIHGFMASSPSPIDRTDTPVLGAKDGGGPGGKNLAWNHPNFSSPGRLDQQKKTSDSSLHFQYGSRGKNNNGIQYHTPHSRDAGVRVSGTGSRTTMMVGVTPGEEDVSAAYGGSGYGQAQALNSNNNNTIHNTLSSQEMTMSTQHQQPQPSYQGADTRPSSVSPRQSHGMISTFHHTPSAGHTQPQTQHLHQQHQYSMHASVSPTTVPFIEDDQHAVTAAAGAGLGAIVSSVAAMNLNDNRVSNGAAQHQQIMRLQQQQQQQQQQHQYQPDDHQRISSVHSYLNATPNNANGGSNRNSTVNLHPGYNGAGGGNIGNNTAKNDFKNNNSNQYYHYTEPSHAPYAQPDQSQYQIQQQQRLQQQQQQQFLANQPRLTATYPNERPAIGGAVTANNNVTNTGKPMDLLANAGPLIDGGTSQRPLTSNQVFAQLTRQFPTNPKEAEKRERIYRWLDQVADALTLNPDTDRAGSFIPVYPDEHDHPESPFYLDRITYELDLMAPVGRSFRKAIDINCNTGDWAM